MTIVAKYLKVSSSAQTTFVPASYDFKFSSPNCLTSPANPLQKGMHFAPYLHRYGVAKLANSVFAAELQRRLDSENTGILSLSINPGPTATKGAEGAFFSFMAPLMRLAFSSPETSAVTLLFAATSREVKLHSDVYKG